MQRFLLTLTIFFLNNVNLQGQWEVLNKGIKGGLSSVDFIDDDTGWMAGGEGLFMNTKDGGLTWNSIPINEEWDIENIDFINETDGWAIGWAGDIESEVIFPLWLPLFINIS